jgi:hypothetical protein
MPWALPTSSHFWSDRPTSRGRFHNVSLDLTSLTSYQPMVEFPGHPSHFHISNQLTYLVKFANFWRWFSQTEFGSNLSNLLPTYGTFFHVILTTCFGRPPMSLTCPLALHVRAHPLFILFNAFFGTTLQVVRCSFSVTYSTPTSYQH